ncbi:MAG TPA: adenylate/guanylate cyclase domain-containing protein [Oligoflexus sp.]|uniref:adenylate/guanylate cyclase domain-containing protein n=1 Tax=Oligoflexus sp. TaxID=1971216 RepID=UPI002D6D7D1B|nr:adenylate/guanylate cyclase domain-containing protein [Oligoflexus sp.]HYX38668.1 adenylate/guanylate cyclase domain-containing protein [Oligoflexus sp.]
MKSLAYLGLFFVLLSLSMPARGDFGRYSIPYQQNVRPRLNLSATPGTHDERLALTRFLVEHELPEAERYSAERQLVFSTEFTDREAFHKLRQKVRPKPDDYMLQSTLAQYDQSLTYLQLVEKLEKYFELASEAEPGTSVAGWIAHDTLAIMTENYDFGRASILVHKAIASLPEDAWVLRSLLLGAIARLYVDPGNSPAIIRQGVAIYADTEARMRQRGRLSEASDSAYNQGVTMLFAFGDDRKALEHFARVDRSSLYYQDANIFAALSQVRTGKPTEAQVRLQQVDLANYPESPGRIHFLQCYMAIIQKRLGQAADLDLCVTLPESTQADVIQHMTDEILQLPLSTAQEFAVLKQFQNFYRKKISPQNKQRMAQSVDGLELARTRAELDRSRYESKINRIKLDLAHKQSQLTSYVALSTIVVLSLVSFGLWRRQVQQHRIQKLQQYLQTRILSRFLPPALVEEIRLGRSRLDEEPQKRTVTIVFADLVDFTAKAELLGPERTARFLNQWMRIATDIIFEENGTIDKFIGDCVMVIYGAPLEITPKAQVERAVACARHLMAAMDDQNKIWTRDFGVSFQLRVGVNLGEAIVGSFGSEKRSDYTVIGGAVNLASRIENMAEPGQILLSRSAASYLDPSLVSSLGTRPIRGMQGAQELFQVRLEELQSAV